MLPVAYWQGSQCRCCCVALCLEYVTHLTSESLSKMTTTILFYNTHLFLDTHPVRRTILDDEERTDAIVRSILRRRPEIVALCEVWAEARASRVARGLERDYPFHFRPETRAGFALSSGLLLMSRLPIRKAEFTPYYDSPDHRRADMGFVTAALSRPDTDELTCRLIMTHDQATFDDDVERYAKIRSQNRTRIIQRANEFPPDNVPLIVTGDLNVIGETTEYESMREQYEDLGLIDMWMTHHSESPSAPTAPEGLTYSGSANPLIEAFDGKEMARSEERLDYVWVSASTRPGWRKCSVERHAYEYRHSATEIWPASDHYPLEASLDL
ncbi:MAG: endonuclease/exonuclease/phosphatase family metal-dependent hydrolase [Gammaproteobacteria bacterium]|jgi:endonuclease/exonuclease/phosphatase family metal-dependent hydrolase